MSAFSEIQGFMSRAQKLPAPRPPFFTDNLRIHFRIALALFDTIFSLVWILNPSLWSRRRSAWVSVLRRDEEICKQIRNFPMLGDGWHRKKIFWRIFHLILTQSASVYARKNASTIWCTPSNIYPWKYDKIKFPKSLFPTHSTLPFSMSAGFEYAAQQQNHSKYVIIVQNIISICILWEKIIFRHGHSMGNRSTFNNKVNYVLQRGKSLRSCVKTIWRWIFIVLTLRNFNLHSYMFGGEMKLNCGRRVHLSLSFMGMMESVCVGIRFRWWQLLLGQKHSNSSQTAHFLTHSEK